MPSIFVLHQCPNLAWKFNLASWYEPDNVPLLRSARPNFPPKLSAMKFAEELEAELVPEWRPKYFDYKQGKKRVKAVGKALHNIEKSMNAVSLRLSKDVNFAQHHATYSGTADRTKIQGQASLMEAHGCTHKQEIYNKHIKGGSAPPSPRRTSQNAFPSVLISGRTKSRVVGTGRDTDAKLTETYDVTNKKAKYRNHFSPLPFNQLDRQSPLSALALPGPAMDEEYSGDISLKELKIPHRPQLRFVNSETAVEPFNSKRHDRALEVNQTKSPVTGFLERSIHGLRTIGNTMMIASRRENASDGQGDLSFLSPTWSMRSRRQFEMPLEGQQIFNSRNAEFEIFLEQQLQKIEKFYKDKEDESTQRLGVLREQLHIMRNQHVKEVQARAANKRKKARSPPDPLSSEDQSKKNGYDHHHRIVVGNHYLTLPTAHKIIENPIQVAKHLHFKQSPTLHYVSTPEHFAADHSDTLGKVDSKIEVPYFKAKQKLKAALQEFHRGLELLKAYTRLNRTAFWKISKKYNKTTGSKASVKLVFQKADKAYFVTSDILDGYLTTVEDLYARYFEKGDHKTAMNKLRLNTKSKGTFSGSAFRSGLLGGLGVVFGVRGTVYAVEIEKSPNTYLSTHTGFLLQIYGGFFLLIFSMILFCLACKIFKDSKVNYVFVFEFDNRHHLDWWQLSEIPCLCLCLLGCVMWLNFSNFTHSTDSFLLYDYYPVIYSSIILILLLFPARVLYHHSRRWLLVALWRLFWSGFYPVEFRDFFLGDMFVSQAFAMGNIELFFCLYASRWVNTKHCTSSQSELFGFFVCLPAIWRFIQCIRRYIDSRQINPHLANGGKYTCTILYYMTLSIFRIHKNKCAAAVFITFAGINSLYSIYWDLVKDWSLLKCKTSPPLLREHRAYKSTWTYYTAMAIDCSLRFSWILYVAFPDMARHSSLLSFAVSSIEVFRRGLWAVFRVESEHCANVRQFRASKDAPLPYELDPVQLGDYQRKTGLAPEAIEADRDDDDIEEDRLSDTSVSPNKRKESLSKRKSSGDFESQRMSIERITGHQIPHVDNYRAEDCNSEDSSLWNLEVYGVTSAP